MLTETDILRQIAINKQEVIAEAIGLSPSEFSRKVSGRTNWTLEQLCKLLPAINIEARVMGTKSESEDYVKALETVLRHKLSESE